MAEIVKLSRAELYDYTKHNRNLLQHSIKETQKRSWSCSELDHNVGKRVRFRCWHSSVDEAISVELDSGMNFYMHYADLRPFDESMFEKPKESFFFEPENLCI